jgi:hypothetical protein
MSMMKRLLAILAVASAISPVAAQKARVDFDHAGDFSHYQTYRWAAPPNADVLNQLMQLRVIGFVEEALAARHLKRVETGGDLLVNFQMDVRQENVYTTFADTTGFGWGWGWGSTMATTTTQVITLGTLTVDLVDSHRNRLVFQGVSTAPISSKPAHNTKRLAKAVNQIFEKYPPR